MKIPKETIQESKMRYLNPVDHNQRRITKPNKEFAQKIDFKNIKFPVKIRDIHKIENRIKSAFVFLAMKIGKKHNIYVQKNMKKTMLIHY